MKKINILISAILMITSFSLTAQVAITASVGTADASAILDVQSTTKGILYPCMTLTQRQAISSPATGLMIYNTTTNNPNYFNGTVWMNCDGTIALAIGDSYQGGIIFYMLQSGDPGYDANVLHGLIAPTSDQSAGIAWITGGLTQSTTNGNTLTALGTGQANTNFMMAQTGYTGGAAQVCDDYTNTETGTGVYSDWYLPSKDELNKLYLNNAVVGGFVTNNDYWSSSESGQWFAWLQYLSGQYAGDQASNNKSVADNPVRAIRTF